MNTHLRGREGEDRAVSHLEEQGYKIFERNYRNGGPEVDIIAGVGDILCFCEVKSWRDVPAGDLLRSINATKRRRLIRAALLYLQKHPEFASWNVRFDVIFLSESVTPVQHFESAFDASV